VVGVLTIFRGLSSGFYRDRSGFLFEEEEMTEQEELLNWLNKYLIKRFISDPDELPDDECLVEAKEILNYLVSKGVVIRTPNTRGENVEYPVAVEPLMKRSKL